MDELFDVDAIGTKEDWLTGRDKNEVNPLEDKASRGGKPKAAPMELRDYQQAAIDVVVRATKSPAAYICRRGKKNAISRVMTEQKGHVKGNG